MKNIVDDPAVKYNYVSQEVYLETEREALEKHEYYQGEIFAMSGASARHNRIFTNLFIDIGIKLKGKGCLPYGSDLRIHIPKNTLYTYPDISIICGEMEFTDDKLDTVTNPSVIIELLSNSTRNYDKGEKFTLYRDITSLQEYILIDTEKIHVEKHIRNADNSWQLTDFKSIENSFTISTIQLSFLLEDIYEGISFE
ncbi:MAG: Uma2 family endonuclease [Ferruginibacter sp.]|nr:Uma2 family endonuclease [Chitinophagaceae bacterium]